VVDNNLLRAPHSPRVHFDGALLEWLIAIRERPRVRLEIRRTARHHRLHLTQRQRQQDRRREPAYGSSDEPRRDQAAHGILSRIHYTLTPSSRAGSALPSGRGAASGYAANVSGTLLSLYPAPGGHKLQIFS